MVVAKLIHWKKYDVNNNIESDVGQSRILEERKASKTHFALRKWCHYEYNSDAVLNFVMDETSSSLFIITKTGVCRARDFSFNLCDIFYINMRILVHAREIETKEHAFEDIVVYLFFIFAIFITLQIQDYILSYRRQPSV